MADRLDLDAMSAVCDELERLRRVANGRVERFAAFTMSDGSPAFRERQLLGEPLAHFVRRMQRVTDNGGGYVSPPSFYRAVVTDDPEAVAALAALDALDGD